MEMSRMLDSQLRSLQSSSNYSLMKKAMNFSEDITQKLLESVPSPEETRAMELSVNPEKGNVLNLSL